MHGSKAVVGNPIHESSLTCTFGLVKHVTVLVGRQHADQLECFREGYARCRSIWTDRRIPAACRGAVFHDQIVESSWSRSPRLSRVKSIFPCRPCMAIAWADISAVMSPRQCLGMAVRSEETSTIQPDVVRHQRGAQSRPFSEPRDRTASGAGTSGRPSGTLPVQPARNML